MTNKYYPNMFKPLKVGSIELRNRIIASPVGKVSSWTSPSDDFEVFAAKARGGAGMLVIGSISVDDDRASIVQQDLSIPANLLIHNELVSIAHQYGAKISAELIHCGMFANPIKGARPPIGPDTFVRTPGDYQGIEGVENNAIMDGKTVRGMTKADMDEVAGAFASAALEAKRVGYDMCMLHFAHGWLPAQFLSPFFNHRKDEYGGSLENRMRFPRMIINRVREAVGKEYPLDMRIGAYEWLEGGLQPTDIVEFVKRVEDKIDLVHVTSGIDKFLSTTARIETPSIFPRNQNVSFAEMIKKAVSIPVCTVAGINVPDEIEQMIGEGRVDAVAMGRGLIADPEFPNKARTGHADEIVPCLRCVNCYHVATEGYSQGCSVNPYYGRQARLTRQLTPAIEQKKVVVIGGGPAGMKAAITAFERGHHVIIFEKEKALGGLMRVTESDGTRTEKKNYERYLINKIEKSGIELHLGVKATPEIVKAQEPDNVIIAIGSKPRKPSIPGINKAHVMDIVSAHFSLDSIGEAVTIIGGGQSGCEFALRLSELGHRVTLLEASGEICTGANLLYKQAMKDLIAADKKIDCRLATLCLSIGDGLVALKGTNGESEIKADTVIYAVGMKALYDEAHSFSDIVYDARLIGDCAAPRRITEATHEGFFAGAVI